MISKLIGMFKPKGINRNYLQLPEFKVNIARQVKQRQNLSKNFSNKKWRKNTKVLEIGPGPGHFFRTLKFLGYRTNNYAIEPQIDAHPNLEFLGVEIVKDTLNTKVLTKMPEKNAGVGNHVRSNDQGGL